MARPSIKQQRREQILDAFTRCIRQQGIQGASLERIAELAGLTRQSLRHFVGNRDDLVVALAERYLAAGQQQIAELEKMLPKSHRTLALLEICLADDAVDEEENALGEALLSESGRLPQVRELLSSWLACWREFITRVIAEDFPLANAQEVAAVATSVVNAVIVGDSLRTIVDWQQYRREALDALQMHLARWG